MGGGSTETKSEPPKWFSEAAKKSLTVADQINQAGYVPYMGNEVAAFTPQQREAMQSASDWSSAANGAPRRNAMRGMPKATTDASGVAGYGSYNGLMANLGQLKARSPEQYEQLTRFGGDPLATPGSIPRDITNSPWGVGAAASANAPPALPEQGNPGDMYPGNTDRFGQTIYPGGSAGIDPSKNAKVAAMLRARRAQ